MTLEFTSSLSTRHAQRPDPAQQTDPGTANRRARHPHEFDCLLNCLSWFAVAVERDRKNDLLRDAFDLFDVATMLTRQRLQRQHPDWTDVQLDAAVTEWFLTRPGAPDGDVSGGRVVPWPRRKTT